MNYGSKIRANQPDGPKILLWISREYHDGRGLSGLLYVLGYLSGTVTNYSRTPHNPYPEPSTKRYELWGVRLYNKKTILKRSQWHIEQFCLDRNFEKCSRVFWHLGVSDHCASNRLLMGSGTFCMLAQNPDIPTVRRRPQRSTNSDWATPNTDPLPRIKISKFQTLPS